MKYLIERFIKYFVVGLSNALLTTLVYYAFLQWLHVHYILSFSISWVSGVLYSYVVNYVWAFKQESSFAFDARFCRYLIIYVSSYGLNVILLKIVVESWNGDPFWSQLFILPLIVLINFFGINYWALKKDN